MKLLAIFLLALTFGSFNNNILLTEIGPGEQPQLSVDPSGIVRLVYGKQDKIFYAYSADNGNTFSQPDIVGEIYEMHLGMTRGPQLASSKDYSVVTAMDKKGNIHSFRLAHKTGKWAKLGNVNDIDGSAPEGLMSISSDDQNNFYAVWLDLREDKNNKIALSVLNKNNSWSKNKVLYKSPDKTVCECCKPSIVVKDKRVAIMFRNWIEGSRDLHWISSVDGGKTFTEAKKLGNGTWKLKGCPMDGGGILFDKKNAVHTVWQREGTVYYDQPGQPESRVAEGRSCSIFGKDIPIITWQEGDQIYYQRLNTTKSNIGEGTAANVIQLKDNSLLAVWEKEDHIVLKKL